MWKNLKMKNKIVVSFLLVGLLPMGILGGYSLMEGKAAIQEKVENQLAYVRDVKTAQIENYFQQKITGAAVLSRTSDAIIAYRALNAYMEDEFMDPSGSYNVSTPDYQEIYNQKCAAFQEYMREYGYSDVYLIHGETGHVMYSGTKGKDLGANLKIGPYANSGLAQLWQDVKGTGEATLTEITPYEPLGGQPAMFTGSPMLDGNGNVTSVVAFQISLQAVDSILHERSGLGETGEAYLVGSDGLMRSNARLSETRTILKQEIQTDALASALGGKTSVGTTENYRDAATLSALGPVRIGTHNWAIVAEMATDEVFAATDALQIATIVISILAGMVVIAAGWLLARSISAPLERLLGMTNQMTTEFGEFVEFVDAVSQKDLTRKLPESQFKKSGDNSTDEIGELVTAIEGTFEARNQIGDALGQMTNNLREMINQLTGSADLLVTTAGEIASSSEQMSRGANDQTQQMSQISTAVEEMTATIVESSRNAGDATDASNTAASTATDGGEIVAETIQGMQRIASTVRESAESIGKLATSADQIGEIASVIDDITDQTNLLALNAAIEAARAGEQGRGFAVVADEVRKLAERTAKATGEISDMIKGIQDETHEAVQSMESGTAEVDSGRDLADKAGTSLSEIVSVTQRVMDMIRQIATAAEEQSAAAEQISKNVEQVTAITRETATGAEQSATAAEELNRQAEGMQEMVKQFKVEH